MGYQTSTEDLLEIHIWPKLSHELVFKNLSGLKPTRTGVEADCPKCGAKGTFYAVNGARYGACNRKNNCGYKVGWWNHVMNSHGFTKQQTLYFLADIAGVQIPGRSQKTPLNLGDQHEIREAIVRYGRLSILSGDPGAIKIRNYLMSRGFTLEEIKNADLMYIDRMALTRFFSSKGIQEKTLKHTGISTRQFGEEYRLFLPFRGEDGKVEGFIGRLDPGLEPIDGVRSKYKNSFGLDKSVPFQFHEANREDVQTMMVVEGPLDAVLLKCKKVKGVVALCGDFPSRDAEEKIRTSRPPFIMLALDDDKAGISATMKLLSRLSGARKRLFVPRGYQGAKDPGDMIKEKGLDSFVDHIKGVAVPGSYWALLQMLPRIKGMGAFGRATELAQIGPILQGENEEDRAEFLAAAESETLLHPDDIRVAVGG